MEVFVKDGGASAQQMSGASVGAQEARSFVQPIK